MWQYRGKVTRIVDGDTIDVLCDLGFGVFHSVRCRLARIDTPEKGQPGASEATERVRALAPVGSAIHLATNKGDRYGRWIAEIFTVTGLNVSDTLLAEGLAKAYK